MKPEPMYLHYFTSERIFPFFIQYGHHDRDHKWHYHADFYELMIVMDGTAKQQINHQNYYIKRGDVFVFGEGVSHNFEDVRDLHICNIMFQPSALTDRYHDLGQISGYHDLFIIEPYLSQNDKFQHYLKLRFRQFDEVSSLIRKMYEEYNSDRPGRRTMVMAYFQMLITYLSRCYGEQSQDQEDKTSMRIARSVSCLEQNFRDDFSIKELAEMSYVSERHFLRQFSEVYHTTPHQYLIKLRL
ncbi:AraC family transcriptional regulator [Jutongia sp.]